MAEFADPNDTVLRQLWFTCAGIDQAFERLAVSSNPMTSSPSAQLGLTQVELHEVGLG